MFLKVLCQELGQTCIYIFCHNTTHSRLMGSYNLATQTIQLIMKKTLGRRAEAGAGFSLGGGEVKASRRRQILHRQLNIESTFSRERGGWDRRDECSFQEEAHRKISGAGSRRRVSLTFHQFNVDWCLLHVAVRGGRWGQALPVPREDGGMCWTSGPSLHRSGSFLRCGTRHRRAGPFYHIKDLTFRTLRPLKALWLLESSVVNTFFWIR